MATIPFVKGERYYAYIDDYYEALIYATECKKALESKYKAENPYLSVFIMPFIKGRKHRYCIKVWMDYSDMTDSKDIRIEIYFTKNWFAAARKAVAKRQARREEWDFINTTF